MPSSIQPTPPDLWPVLLHHGLNAYPPFTQRKQWQEMSQTLQSYAEIISQECLTLTTQKRGLHRLSFAHKKATNTVASVLQGGMKVKKQKGHNTVNTTALPG